ncbi:MAG: tripartite tricarboxylate transporter TctB family protein [Pseudomonadales bacterium]
MQSSTGNLIISAAALSISGLVLFSLPGDVDNFGLNTFTDMASAAFFPLLAATIVGICAIGLLVMTMLDRDNNEGKKLSPVGWRPVAMLAGFSAFIPLIHLLGMVTASALVVIALSFIFGFRDLRWTLPVAAVLPVSVYFLFERILKVLFPHGLIF